MTLANAPLWLETGDLVPLICPTAPAKYFSREGWTGVSQNSPTGNAARAGPSAKPGLAAGASDSMGKSMDAEKIAVDAVVALTECDRDVVAAFIRRFYLAGVTDPKRLTFKGLQAMAQG